MSARLRLLFSIGFLSAVQAAGADPLVIPGIGPQPYPHPRTAYRQAAFPPPQYGLLGQPLPPTGVEPRPSYRQTENQFPPLGGRYGGGFIEYVMTGGRPEPVAPQYAATAAPNYVQPTYGATPYAAPSPAAYVASPLRAALPQAHLPDYAPGSPVYVGAGPAESAAAPIAYAPVPSSASQPIYATPGAGYDPVAADPGLVTRPMSPIYYRQMVGYAGREPVGTIVIDTPNKFLYLVEGGGRAIRYGIGVGRPGFAWAGIKRISRKAEWPDWTPPAEMLARRPDLPRHMAGGEANPLGARALYLGSSLYRIHGTNEPYTIGTNVSSGCIRMMNQDVIDLYGRVGVGTRVIVL